MSSFSFGVTKQPVFGTYGEFTVGTDKTAIRANFLLTKVRPANDGTWESDLASMMVPWREVFKLEEMSFDELLQRDLDDSRVAHDLVPYLLGKSGTAARFFPPILAVIVPKNPSGSGIESYYPPVKDKVDKLKAVYGDLFEFETIALNGEATPLGTIRYNRQKSAFVIVDGQHRAMAVLALYRQLTKSWGNSAYESFYQHINITAEEVKRIEMPVCLIYFPDLCADNSAIIERGIDLRHVCREIFLVVNRTAKQVSPSRQLLLDDDDFCARMMRRTLSKLKDRKLDEVSVGKIYSISYGDSENDVGKTVLAGQLEYSSAIAIHKMHMIASFSNPAIFKWENPSDATDGRSLKNPSRPAEILAGTELSHWPSLTRKSAMEHAPGEVDKAVSLLGAITDATLLRLFDTFRPFVLQNETVSLLRVKLTQPESKADSVQNKCFNLLFEGSGVKAVFDEHFQRLTNLSEDAGERGEPVPDYVKLQLEYCKAVEKALELHEQDIRRRRACSLFNIAFDAIAASPDAPDKWKVIEARAKSVFDTISTQAFQIGFQMAVLTVVQEILAANVSYQERLKVVETVAELFIGALNEYFSSGKEVQHKTITGYINDSRAQVFDPQGVGLRGLLRLSVSELNERQWDFFRYALLELVLCAYSSEELAKRIQDAQAGSVEEQLRSTLPVIAAAVVKLRANYIEAAENAALRTGEFRTKVITIQAEKRAAGLDEADVTKAVEELRKEQKKTTRALAKQHLKASIGKLETAEQICGRLTGVPIAESVVPVTAGEPEGEFEQPEQAEQFGPPAAEGVPAEPQQE